MLNQSARFRLLPSLATLLIGAAFVTTAVGQSGNAPLERDAARWIDDTLGSLSLDEKIGQLIAPCFYTGFVSSDPLQATGIAPIVALDIEGDRLATSASQAGRPK